MKNNGKISHKAKKGVTNRIVKEYETAEIHGSRALFNYRRVPLFHRLYHVPAMLEDSRIQMTLMVMKGMITSLSRFYIDEGESERTDDVSEIKEFLIKQVSRFWRVGANRLLSSMEWGWYGAEPLYKVDQHGRVCFHDFTSFKARDVAPVTLDGDLCGIELRSRGRPGRTYLGGMQAFWHVHWRHKHQWWGGSRLQGAYQPWYDLHSEGGGLDIVRKYYYKHVYQGDIFRHPPGSDMDENGVATPYKEIARSMAEKEKSGGVITMPSTTDAGSGKPVWDVQPRVAPQAGDDIREWIADLRRDETEGVGLSEELFQASQTGSGYSGRRIPETAARGMLTEVVFWMITDFDKQVLRPLVKLNFGIEPDYEIIPFGLVKDDEDDDVPVEGNQPVPDRAVNNASGNGGRTPLRLAV